MLTIDRQILDQCYAFGTETYPEEACGVISGSKDEQGHLEAIHPMKNRMDEYHEKDPERFPRTNRNAYMIDPLEFNKLQRSLKKQEQQIKVIYHTHPDVGAYFSEKDRKDALLDNGDPRQPGVQYLVCGITNKQKDGAILATYNPNTKDFDVTRIE